MSEVLRGLADHELVRSTTRSAHIESLRTNDEIDYSLLANTISSAELTHLSKTQMAWVALFAGLGHLRCLQAASDGLQDTKSQWNRIMIDTISSKVHSFGSNNVFAKIFTEHLQRSSVSQRLFAPVMNEIIYRNDASSVLEAAHTYLGERKNESSTVFVFFHPDSAYIISRHRDELERIYNRKIFLAIVMTDRLHERSQFNVIRLGTDLLITPDEESKDLAEAEIDKWWRIMRNRQGQPTKRPQVVSVPFVLSSLLTKELSDQAYKNRLEQVDPESSTPLKILIPLGGSSPQQKKLYEIQQFLHYLTRGIPKPIEIYILGKSTLHNQDFLKISSEIGAKIMEYSSNQEAIDAFPRALDAINPAIQVTKPSELQSQTLIHPTQIGGPLILFTSPVGDQESQNVSWNKLKGMLPSQQDKRFIEQLLLNREQGNIPNNFDGLRRWRGLELPNDSFESAFFITNALKSGMFKKMMGKRELHTHRDLQQDGSVQLLRLLDKFVEEQMFNNKRNYWT